MQHDERRSEPRYDAGFPGTLTLGDRTEPCTIQNMCSRGFLIEYASNLPVGQLIRLTCEIYPSQTIECTVQVRHVNSRSLGARVVEMNDDGRRLCLQYIAEQRAREGT